MSSMTSRTGRSSPASSAISLCTRPEPSKCGDGASGVRICVRSDGCAELFEHRKPEALGVLLVAPNRDPRRTAGEVRFVDPRAQQHRLPAAGRRRDERDAACEPGGQALEEFRPRDNGRRVRTRGYRGSPHLAHRLTPKLTEEVQATAQGRQQGDGRRDRDLCSATPRSCTAWPIRTTSADIDRPVGMMRAHPLKHDAHGMRDLHKDARYEIRIRGILGGTVAGAFPGLLAREDRGETVLTGRLPDQAALHGVLAQIEALGLELIEIKRR